ADPAHARHLPAVHRAGRVIRLLQHAANRVVALVIGAAARELPGRLAPHQIVFEADAVAAHRHRRAEAVRRPLGADLRPVRQSRLDLPPQRIVGVLDADAVQGLLGGAPVKVALVGELAGGVRGAHQKAPLVVGELGLLAVGIDPLRDLQRIVVLEAETPAVGGGDGGQHPQRVELPLLLAAVPVAPRDGPPVGVVAVAQSLAGAVLDGQDAPRLGVPLEAAGAAVGLDHLDELAAAVVTPARLRAVRRDPDGGAIGGVVLDAPHAPIRLDLRGELAGAVEGALPDTPVRIADLDHAAQLVVAITPGRAA